MALFTRANKIQDLFIPIPIQMHTNQNNQSSITDDDDDIVMQKFIFFSIIGLLGIKEALSRNAWSEVSDSEECESKYLSGLQTLCLK